MTRIFLIRHAEAEGNIYRRAHGNYDGKITQMGHVQIEHLRQRFNGEKIDHIYSSDLNRTITTAKALSEPRGLPINTTPMLREVNMGVWEGLAWGDIEHIAPKMSKLFGKDPINWRVDGGESYEQVQSRMMRCLNEICEKHAGENVAVFSHGFAIRALMCRLLGVESHETHKVPYFDNSAVTLLIYDNGEFSALYQGDNSHLTDEISTFARQTWWREKDERIKENLRYEKVESSEEGISVNHLIHEIAEKLHLDIVYLAFLDDVPVGLFGLDIVDDRVGMFSYYYIKPEYDNRNFLDQFIGQAMFALYNLSKKVVQVKIPIENEYAKSIFLMHGFKVISEGNVNLLEKEII